MAHGFGRKRQRLKLGEESVHHLGASMVSPLKVALLLLLLCLWPQQEANSTTTASSTSQQNRHYLARLNKLGLIRGRSLDGGAVAAFLGVPYAAPPVGPLRFMPPGAYSGPQSQSARGLDQTQFGHSCVRLHDWLDPKPAGKLSDQQSEDCLNANIFVPIQAGNEHELSSGRPFVELDRRLDKASEQKQRKPALNRTGHFETDDLTDLDQGE